MPPSSPAALGPVTLPVHALLFDLGGVLIELDFERAFAHWAAASGTDVATIRSRFRPDEFYERHETGAIDAARYFASLRESLGLDLDDAAFEAGWGAIFIREAPGIRELLGSLDPEIPRYVFSNTNASHQRVWSAQFAGLLACFREVFVSCELGKRKPTPEAFHAVAQAIDVAPENILFFDDTSDNVRGALAVGMQAVHVQSISDIERAIAENRDKMKRSRP